MKRAAWLWLGLLGATPALADFVVATAAPAIQTPAPGERKLVVNARLGLMLNAATEEALHNGIPLEILIDIEFVRSRWWWTNKLIADWTLRRRLSFHALSRQYLVSTPTLNQPTESFGSLEQALQHTANLARLELPLTPKKQIDAESNHLLRLRARLDIEALPTVMRPLAYASPSWRLNSGWTSWPVQQ